MSYVSVKTKLCPFKSILMLLSISICLLLSPVVSISLTRTIVSFSFKAANASANVLYLVLPILTNAEASNNSSYAASAANKSL